MNDFEKEIKTIKEFYEEQLIELCKYPSKRFEDNKNEWGDNND